MTDSRYLSQREFSTLKSRLTRAKNSNDPAKVIAEVKHFATVLEGRVYPDNWSMWQRAADDAYLTAQRNGIAVERVDLS